MKIEIDFKYVNIIGRMKDNSNHAFQDFLLSAFPVHLLENQAEPGF